LFFDYNFGGQLFPHGNSCRPRKRFLFGLHQSRSASLIGTTFFLSSNSAPPSYIETCVL
jgi:hypothetical protein